MSDTSKDKDLEETKRIMTRLVKTPPTPHKSEAEGDQLAFPIESSDRLSEFRDATRSKLLSSGQGDRLDVTVGAYVGPALPALDNGAVGWVIRKRDGRTTFSALK